METTTIRRRIRRKVLAALISMGGFIALASTAAAATQGSTGTAWL